MPTAAGLLVAATNTAQALAAVSELERCGCTWVPLGAKEGNFGLVNIGSDPALAFVERITNAIDGVLERAARESDSRLVKSLDSPREAARDLFAIGDGRLASLEDTNIARLAAAVTITITDGSATDRPTLEVRDRGVGIAPETMRSSILDLAGSNKLDKPYLAGAYGQGGSTTFGFTASGSIVASSADGRFGSATYVRYRALDPRKNKNGRYEYLVDADGKPPHFRAAAATFERGTLVRHFDFELPRHAGALDASSGLLGLVSGALFDPVLPIRLVERRTRWPHVPEIVFAGSARRLGRSPQCVTLHQSLGIPIGPRGRSGLAAIRYWLLDGSEAATAVRPDERSVVFVTNFGQTHDVWPRSFAVDDLRMPFLKNSLVVQVELDDLTASAKRELLSTTRDRLKRGSLFNTLHDAIRDALADEPALVEANAERRRMLISKQRAADHERLQRRFADLMETFRPGQYATGSRNGTKGQAQLTRDGGGTGPEAQPLPTLEHPTFLRFAGEAAAVELPRARAVRLVMESDAPDGYVARYPEARLVVAPDPTIDVTFVRASDFHGGRARIVVRADGSVGATGILATRLSAADGSVLAATRAYRIVEAPPMPVESDGRARIAVPNVFEVGRDRWSEHDFDERSVATVSESRDDFSIFINVDNVHLSRLIDSVTYQQTGLTRMRSTFVVQAAFYAFLLHRERERSVKVIEFDVLERYERNELDRVAQTIVSSIAAIERIDAAALFDADG